MYLIHIIYFITGLIIGSFINVIIYRTPNNLSIVKPRSFCIFCKKKIPLYNNIPLVSYIIQLGKCLNCKKNISISYPLIEFSIGVIWLISYILFNDFNYAINYAVVSSLLIAIAVIDYKYFIIPIEISLFLLFFISIMLFLNNSMLNNLTGLLVGTGYLSIISLITWGITKRQGLGFGDLQLILVLGYWVGDLKILFIIFTSALFAIIFWLIISYYKGFDNKRALPFGSFLSISSIILYPINFNDLHLI
tara:strand:+ start:460 stop:1206 length:747 start_codon:yes stop_codon:yes gene_type:complete